MIGGLAAAMHGSPTVTVDIDICYEREPANLARLASALAEVYARLRDAPEDPPFRLDARSLANGDSFTFETDDGPLDTWKRRPEPRAMPTLRRMPSGSVPSVRRSRWRRSRI